jgi:hypothetical protein
MPSSNVSTNEDYCWQKKNVKINNLKIARKLKVIGEEEFKILDFENYK